jgi:hypothetical protein
MWFGETHKIREGVPEKIAPARTFCRILIRGMTPLIVGAKSFVPAKRQASIKRPAGLQNHDSANGY